jgi:ribosome-binding ATPase YchF (GTP1/OBG family)
VVVCAKFEADMMWLSDEEREMFVEEMKWGNDIKIPTLDDLISLAFDTVGLMYYFTTGEKETRAWTIKKWWTAPQAAGVIHGDFERGFIRAEAVTYEKFVEAGGRSGAREKWYLRSEGKDYVVQDGDVLLFRFNV